MEKEASGFYCMNRGKGRSGKCLKLNFFGHAECHMGIVVHQPGIEPALPALDAQSFNHWTTKGIP